MILALGYWVLGNICRYWELGSIVIGWYFFHCDTQYDTDQTAVSTVHMITILTSVVRPLSADDSRESGEGIECKLYIIIIQFWDFMCYSVVYILLQNQYTAMLHSSISVVIGWCFFHCDTQYNNNQTTVSTVHKITILTFVVRLLSADDSRESGEGVECKLYIIIIIQFSDFMWHSVVYILLQNQYIAMLHSSISIGIDYWTIGIARGQYYWILDIGCLVWYRSNPSCI